MNLDTRTSRIIHPQGHDSILAMILEPVRQYDSTMSMVRSQKRALATPGAARWFNPDGSLYLVNADPLMWDAPWPTT